MNGTANVNDIAVFTASGLKGSTNIKNTIGLDNVDNTSDLNKPISNAVQTALSNKQDILINGILDNNNITVDSSSVINGDYAKFTSKGLEGRSIIQLKNDLAITHSDIDLSSYNGSTSITTTGIITSGTWQGSTINETYIDNSIARKTYVDSVAQGLDIKDAVKVTTTTNIILNGTQTIDGIAVVVDDRVLVKNQTNSIENGIYLVKSGAWMRANDLNTGSSISSGVFTFIEQGIIYGSSGWVLTSNSGTVGTDSLTFSQFSGAGSSTTVTGGLIINGSGAITLDTPANVKSILNYLDNSDLTSYSGSSNIVELGTINSGTWEGDKITDAYINSAATWNNKQNALTFGISNNNSIVVDGIANSNDYAIFTTNGIKGQSAINLKSDLSLNLVENIKLSVWNGSSNISTIGTITSGIWQGTAITDDYINSASTWNDKQDALSFTSSSLTNGKVVIMNGTANQDDIAVFTASGIKGSNYSSIKTSIGLDNVDNTSDLNKPISAAVQTALSSKQNIMINGISDTNNVVIDGSISSGDYAKFTSNGLEGKSLSELKSELSLTYSDIDLSSYIGSSSITTTGIITNGPMARFYYK